METRKQIIELISDYMDKTLSEGCLIEDEGIIQKVDFNFKDDLYLHTRILGDYNQLVINSNNQSFKIIGHYDMTAVLKYIGKSNGIQSGKYSLHFDDENHYIQEKVTSKIYKILNKPLHLYTEQEEKELLDLLLKLK